MTQPQPGEPGRTWDKASRSFIAAREGRLSEADAADLSAWLAADSTHRQAYDGITAAWDDIGALAADPELIALRRRALANAARGRRRPARLWWAAGIAAACVLSVGAAGMGYLAAFGPERTSTYQTAAGERRAITLEDASKVAMDEGTRLEVRYSGRARTVTLWSGQAEFQVAHDPRRPFAVTAAGRTVVATGTAFNVDLVTSRLVVTLLEGRVLVADAAAWKNGRATGSQTAPPIELRPDDQLIVGADHKVERRSRIDPAATVAWKLGKLVFDNEPMAQAVERLNRYATQKISLLDPALGAIPVTGVFDAGDTRAFVEAVSAQLKIRSVQGPNGALMLYRPT